MIKITLRGPIRYHSTTGLDAEQFLERVARIAEVLDTRKVSLARHALGLYRQVQLALIMLRHHLPQQLAAELYGMSQQGVSRIYRRIVPLRSEVLCTSGISVAEAIRSGHLLLDDGNSVPTRNRPASGFAKTNDAGKHRVQCLNIHLASTRKGDLVAVSDPVPGARHDVKALEACGWKATLNHAEGQ